MMFRWIKNSQEYNQARRGWTFGSFVVVVVVVVVAAARLLAREVNHSPIQCPLVRCRSFDSRNSVDVTGGYA